MARAVAAIGALLITSVLVACAFAGVSWFMNSTAVWAIARSLPRWNIAIWLPLYFSAIWVPLYVSRARKKKPSAEKIETFR